MEKSNKNNVVKVLKTVDCETMLDILNNIDSIIPDSYPIIFRPAGSESVSSAGIDLEHNFIWKDDVLGNIMFLNVEIWENVRINEPFTFYFDESSFEILEGSFTGELLSFSK